MINKAMDALYAAETRNMASDGHEPLLKASPLVRARRTSLLSNGSASAISHHCTTTCRLSDCPRLCPQRGLPAIPEIQLAHLGRHVSGLLVPQTMRSHIKPMKRISRTLRAHCAAFLNYFNAKKDLSSGRNRGG